MFHIDGKDHLIAKDPDLKDNEIRYIVANEDLYDILIQALVMAALKKCWKKLVENITKLLLMRLNNTIHYAKDVLEQELKKEAKMSLSSLLNLLVLVIGGKLIKSILDLCQTALISEFYNTNTIPQIFNFESFAM